MDGLRKGTCGYHEIAHTADWALVIWAPDLAGLLETAARGMYELIGLEFAPGERIWQAIAIDAADGEGLLVAFLNELLYQAEEGLAFDAFELTLTESRLAGRLAGRRIAGQKKEIKAVTFHGLEIRRDEDGLSATVVFDV